MLAHELLLLLLLLLSLLQAVNVLKHPGWNVASREEHEWLQAEHAGEPVKPD